MGVYVTKLCYYPCHSCIIDLNILKKKDLVGLVKMSFRSVSFLRCPIMCLYVLSSDVRYDFCMFGSSLPPVVCNEGSCLIYIIYVWLCILMSNTFCVTFFICLSSSCVSYVDSFSELSIFDSPLLLSNVYLMEYLPSVQKVKGSILTRDVAIHISRSVI